jgi:hypothetical protein
MKIAGLTAALSLAIVILWVWLARRSPGAGPPPESIVLLFRQPRSVDSHILAKLFSEEARLHVEAIAPDDKNSPEDFVMGKDSDHRFVARIKREMFVIYSVAQPYGEKSQQMSKAILELGVRDAWKHQNGWLSIDFLEPQNATPEAYRLIARVLSHFADADCVALYHPPSNVLVLRREDTAGALRAEDPITAVFSQAR